MIPAAPSTPVFPPGRYGRRRDPAYQRRRQWITYVLAAAVIVATVAMAVKLYRQYYNPAYDVTIVSVTGLSDTEVTVTFDVAVPPGEGATCTVRAHTRDGERVGEATIIVPPAPPGQSRSRTTYTLTTTKRPMTGEVPGCGP